MIHCLLQGERRIFPLKNPTFSANNSRKYDPVSLSIGCLMQDKAPNINLTNCHSINYVSWLHDNNAKMSYSCRNKWKINVSTTYWYGYIIEVTF